MFITKKKHQEIINKLEQEHLTKQQEIIEKLEKAECLKEIFIKLTNSSIDTKNKLADSITRIDNLFDKFNSDCQSFILPDTVLQYTEDILGGKVIKQEGNKCLVIDKNGNVKTGLTKQNVDEGYTYKLVRE